MVVWLGKERQNMETKGKYQTAIALETPLRYAIFGPRWSKVAAENRRPMAPSSEEAPDVSGDPGAPEPWPEVEALLGTAG